MHTQAPPSLKVRTPVIPNTAGINNYMKKGIRKEKGGTHNRNSSMNEGREASKVSVTLHGLQHTAIAAQEIVAPLVLRGVNHWVVLGVLTLGVLVVQVGLYNVIVHAASDDDGKPASFFVSNLVNTHQLQHIGVLLHFHGNNGVSLNGHGHHGVATVVHMFANQVHSAWRACEEIWLTGYRAKINE